MLAPYNGRLVTWTLLVRVRAGLSTVGGQIFGGEKLPTAFCERYDYESRAPNK